MSRRKRPQTEPAPPTPPSLREKTAQASGLFIRENVRTMLLFAGFATLVQAFIPWTNSLDDRVPFIVIGSVFLGIAVPRWLWK